MRKRAVTSSESKEEQLNCNICSKPQVYTRRLREHMRKVHCGARSHAVPKGLLNHLQQEEV